MAGPMYGPGDGAPDAKSRAREYSRENFTGRRLLASRRRHFATCALAVEMHAVRIPPTVALIGEVCIREWIGIHADAKNDDADAITMIASKPGEDVFAHRDVEHRNVRVINHECSRRAEKFCNYKTADCIINFVRNFNFKST